MCIRDKHSVQWLMRGDVTSEQMKGHRVKSGVQVIYNDLMNDERAFPGQQRTNTATGSVQQGLDVNLYRSFNAEGAVYVQDLSLIHISEPTRLLSISYAVFCLK